MYSLLRSSSRRLKSTSLQKQSLTVLLRDYFQLREAISREELTEEGESRYFSSCTRSLSLSTENTWQVLRESNRMEGVRRERSFSTREVSRVEAQDELTYARSVSQYNTLLNELSRNRKAYLLRDVYDDMVMDGFVPNRDTFHLTVSGAMRGQRLQDVFFFFNEMKTNGMLPDVVLYNCVITACGSCAIPDRAFKVAEEMEAMGVQPQARTYLALLNACGTAGRVFEARGVVDRMTQRGMSLDEFGIAALITAYKNRRPVTPEAVTKIFELVEQSKGLSKGGKEKGGEEGQGEAGEVGDEGEGRDQRRRNTLAPLVVYRAAIRAMVDLGNLKAVDALVKDLESQRLQCDTSIYSELMRAHAQAKNLDKMLEAFNTYLGIGGRPSLEIYSVLVEGAIKMFTSESMEAAKQLLADMAKRGFFLNARIGGRLLSLACAERYGDYSCAKTIFDMLVAGGQRPHNDVIITFLRGLLYRGTPEDDVQVVQARNIVNRKTQTQISKPVQRNGGAPEEMHGNSS